MPISIFEPLPGEWRWVLRDAAHRVLAPSALFPSPQACWLSLAQVSLAPISVQ